MPESPNSRAVSVIRRVGGLEVSVRCADMALLVIRRVGGLEDQAGVLLLARLVIRRVGGLEVSGRTPRVRTR